MSIFIGRRPEAAFTRVPNTWARDPKLSLKAKGLLTYLLSHEDGYRLTMEQVIAETKEGKSAVYAAIKELIEHEYLRRSQDRLPGGKVGELHYYVADAPAQTASGFAASRKPESGDDQGKQDVSAGETAYRFSASGFSASGKSTTKKTRVLEDQALEDQNTISLSGAADEPATEPGPAPGPERENEEASPEPEPKDPVARMLLDAGCPTDQLDDVRKELTLRHQPRSNAWWRTVAKEGDLPTLVAEVLEALKPAPKLITTLEWKAAVSGEPDCPCGEPGGNLPRPPDGWMTCASCRRASGWTYQDPQPRTEDKHVNGRHKPYRDPVDMAAYDDWSAITGKQSVRSPADQRLADAQPLYEKYKRQEMQVSPGGSVRPGGTSLHLTDSRAAGRDYTEDF